ncbi:MAG: lysine--tRNA ligase [Actinomycetota bacterium]|nr:lysine--tRNA ligase [Actinomycetota bacterium]
MASDDAGSEQESIPYKFGKTHEIGDIREQYGTLEPGRGTGEVVSVAGRILRLRRQGKVVFAELRDWSGSVQLFAGADFTERFDRLARCSLGDWIGASGEVVTTRRGELSVRVDTWELLALATLGFGDKWHGVADIDKRWRHREVDLWANEGPMTTLLTRSRAVRAVRSLLEDRGFVEVETPVLQPQPGGAMARPFVTHHNALDSDFYLRIALELHLKRLVVGGVERVFELGRAFRNEGLSPRHNPEFTMLECYQAYADYNDMAELTEQLVAGAAQRVVGRTVVTYQGRELDLTPPWRRATMTELVSEKVGQQVDLAAGRQQLSRVAEQHGLEVLPAWGAGKIMNELYESFVEPDLWQPVMVFDYPREVSPLARPHRSEDGLVERFEAVVAGRELVNAFSELTDPDIQRENFERQAEAKASGDPEAMAVDEDYLFALMHGLPPTGGLGMGIDRLAMLLTDSSNIREVIPFPTLRPAPDPTAG